MSPPFATTHHAPIMPPSDDPAARHWKIRAELVGLALVVEDRAVT
ncbi:hypothetical protein ACIRRA_17955 [Nocardia sp. NPDC101769]